MTKQQQGLRSLFVLLLVIVCVVEAAPRARKQQSSASPAPAPPASAASLPQLYEDAQSAWREQDFIRATDLFERVLQINPKHTESLESLGVIAGQSGRHEEAYRRFLDAVASDPTHVRSRSNLAFALFSMGRLDEALEAVDQALQLSPNDGTSVSIRQQILNARGTSSSPPPAPGPQQSSSSSSGGNVNQNQHTAPLPAAHPFPFGDSDEEREHLNDFEAYDEEERRGFISYLEEDEEDDDDDCNSLGIGKDGNNNNISCERQNRKSGQANFGLRPSWDIEAAGLAFGLKREIFNVPRDRRVTEAMVRAGYDSPNTRARTNFIGRLGVEMLSVRLSKQERNDWKLTRRTEQRIASRLREWGVALLPAWLPRDLCWQTQLDILDLLTRPDSGMSSIYGTGATHRFDYPLRVEGSRKDVLQRVSTILEPLLVRILGPGAVMAEFSTLTTFPGAASQTPHTDQGMLLPEDLTSRALLYSVFVYLDDLADTTAPLDVWPGTHHVFHFVRDNVKHHMWPPIRASVPAGSIAIMDSRALHGGTANTDIKPRVALYFSFLSSEGAEPLGSTFSLRSIYENANLLSALAKGVVKEKDPQLGRFCFGNYNSNGGNRVRSHYPFLACTPYHFMAGEDYSIDAVYDDYSGRLAIWVNGKMELIEPRFLDVEGGPITTHRICHNSNDGDSTENFTGLVHKIWIATSTSFSPLADGAGAPRPVAFDRLKQHTRGSSSKNNNNAEEYEYSAVHEVENQVFGDHFSESVSLYRRVVRMGAEVTISPRDQDRLHAIFVAGGEGNALRAGRWQTKCIGVPFVLGWSTRRQNVIKDNNEEAARLLSRDAKEYLEKAKKRGGGRGKLAAAAARDEL